MLSMTIDTIDNLSSVLMDLGFQELKKISGRTLGVLVDGAKRLDALQKIEENIEDAYWDKSPSSSSSLGGIRLGRFRIYVKPKNRQGLQSAGLQNEMFLVNTVNECLSYHTKLDIEFSNGTESYSMNKITQCYDVGRSLPKGSKADVVFSDDQVNYSVSLKQSNAEYWSKAERDFGEHGMGMLYDSLKNGIELKKYDTYYKVNPGIAWKVPDEYIRPLVFGDDDATVIKSTFDKNSVEYQQNIGKISIKVDDIIMDEKGFKEKDNMYFLLRNDKSRRSKKLLPGLTLSAVSESRVLNKKGVKILK